MTRRLTRTRRLFVASLVVYFVVSTATAAIRQDPARCELFPCFCWGLFAIVPSPADRAEYGLVVDSTEVSGDFEKLGDHLPFAESIEAYFVTQSLGMAAERSDGPASAKAEETLRRRYLEGIEAPAVIAVVRKVYDPKTRYQTGVVESATPVYEFALQVEPKGNGQ